MDAESTSPAASVGRRSEVDEADDFGVSVADGRVMFGVGRPDTTIASEAVQHRKGGLVKGASVLSLNFPKYSKLPINLADANQLFMNI